MISAYPAEVWVLKRDPQRFLAAISHINELQNADPDHRWPSPLHQERFGKKKR